MEVLESEAAPGQYNRLSRFYMAVETFTYR